MIKINPGYSNDAFPGKKRDRSAVIRRKSRINENGFGIKKGKPCYRFRERGRDVGTDNRAFEERNLPSEHRIQLPHCGCQQKIIAESTKVVLFR